MLIDLVCIWFLSCSTSGNMSVGTWILLKCIMKCIFHHMFATFFRTFYRWLLRLDYFGKQCEKTCFANKGLFTLRVSKRTRKRLVEWLNSTSHIAELPRNKKVLRERKRHTAHCVSSTPYAVLSWGVPPVQGCTIFLITPPPRTLLSGPGQGIPLFGLAGVAPPPSGPGQGTHPPVDRWTDTCQTLPSDRTAYADGKNVHHRRVITTSIFFG